MNPMRPLLLLGSAGLLLGLSQCGEDGDALPVAEPPYQAPPRTPRQDPFPDGVASIRLFASGFMEGRLEPCGCASGQLGGLARRAFHLRQQEDDHVRIEGGNLVSGGSELDLQKFYTAVEILFQGRLPYHALGVGPRDLTLEYPVWSGLLQAYGVPVVSADLLPPEGEGTWPASPFVEQQVNGQTVRITGLTMSLPPKTLPGDGNGLPDLGLLPPAEAWARALEGVAPETLRVLMVHADDETVRRVAGSLEPKPDLVIGVSRSRNEPPAQPERVAGVPVVFPGIRGRMLLDLSLARLPEDGPRLEYRIVALQGSETRPGAMEDDDVKEAILRHRFQVRDDQVLQRMAEQLPTPTGAEYVGSFRCQACHYDDYVIWKDTRHAHAWETLVEAEKDPTRYGWPVTAYPDCVSCHVVGYGRKSGFVDMDTTAQLSDVGCEECHGPGSKHVESPKEHPMGKVGGGFPATSCTKCHDFEQSPDFDYNARWKDIEHGYKDK